MHGLHIALFLQDLRAGADSGSAGPHFLAPFWRPEVNIWSSCHLPELPEGRLLSTRHANDFSVNFGVRPGGAMVEEQNEGSLVTLMVKLTFPPKTELSRESGADLDFQDILVRWRKSLPTVSYFLGNTLRQIL